MDYVPSTSIDRLLLVTFTRAVVCGDPVPDRCKDAPVAKERALATIL